MLRSCLNIQILAGQTLSNDYLETKDNTINHWSLDKEDNGICNKKASTSYVESACRDEGVSYTRN